MPVSLFGVGVRLGPSSCPYSPECVECRGSQSITQPTLVANGNNDIIIPTVNSYLLAGHIPNAELIIYPDANHGFLFQYPHEFAAEVNGFLTRA
jgi:pimeloyl-ACP methyl ester carboxylesterase